MNDLSNRSWRDVMTDWKVWLTLVGCVVVATIAWLLGYG